MHTWHLASDTVHLSYGLKLGYMIPRCWTRLASQNKMYLQIDALQIQCTWFTQYQFIRYDSEILLWCCLPANSRRIMFAGCQKA